jgi:hypothetical protein
MELPLFSKICYCEKVQEILLSTKYIRGYNNKLEGYGIKKLP